MTALRPTLPLACPSSPQQGARRKRLLPKPAFPRLSRLLPDRVGYVAPESVEERIWAELGALPRSRRKRSVGGE